MVSRIIKAAEKSVAFGRVNGVAAVIG